VSIAQGQVAAQRALGSASALTVQTDTERRSEVSAVLGSTLSRLTQTSTIVLIAAIATVLAMMVSAIWQRQGRLDALLSIGMGPWQLARLVFYESGCILIAGCLLGIAAGILGQYLIERWLHYDTGSPIEFAAAWQLGLRATIIASITSIIVATITVLQTFRFRAGATFSTE
jgi:ABC-type lipoprotein release transport system permease subunit